MVNPNRFYTYAYLREDRTPYYVGKGSENRLYDNSRRHFKSPKDKSRIIFLKQNLTEEEAFKHEIYMIAVFGRKDLGTGILHNRTNGGEGASGAIRSCELRQRISKSMQGRTFTQKHLLNLSKSATGREVSEETRKKISKINKGKKLSPETRKRMSESRKGIVFTEERKENIRKSKLGKSTSLKGKTYKEIYGEYYLERIEKLRKSNTGKVTSEETKQKISNSKKGTVAWNKGISVPSKYVYTIKSPDGEIITTRSIKDFCNKNNLSVTCMFRLMNGKQKQHKGWTFLTKLDTTDLSVAFL
jgi:hypothetical protein